MYKYNITSVGKKTEVSKYFCGSLDKKSRKYLLCMSGKRPDNCLVLHKIVTFKIILIIAKLDCLNIIFYSGKPFSTTTAHSGKETT
jgi:hypothetical protein